MEGLLWAKRVRLLVTLNGLTAALIMACLSLQAAETQVPVIFTGGYETDPSDHGRPVVLVAAALEVKPEVFREAFRDVRPARNGKPSAEEARNNKAALMKGLQPY